MLLKFLNKHFGDRVPLPKPTTSDPEISRFFDKIDYLGSYRNDYFPKTGPVMWLDQENYRDLIKSKLKNNEISENDAEICENFAKDGYVVINKLISDEECDSAWNGFIKAIDDHVINPGPEPKEFDPKWGRVGNVHHYVKEMHKILHHPNIVKKLDMLMGKKTIPYQTIPSLYGSEQLAHSDAIHMTTFPLGYMSAAWVALEDIHEDSGPLEYYPGSHKLPYHLSKEVGIKINESNNYGREPYLNKYEPHIQNIIEKNKLEKKFFNAKKGDVLLWHHNLIHAGSKVNNTSVTRKSIVCHYFTENVFAYHDLTNSAADVAGNGDFKL